MAEIAVLFRMIVISLRKIEISPSITWYELGGPVRTLYNTYSSLVDLYTYLAQAKNRQEQAQDLHRHRVMRR